MSKQDFESTMFRIQSATQNGTQENGRPPAIENTFDSIDSVALRNKITEGLQLAGIANPTQRQIDAIFKIGHRESHWRDPPSKGHKSLGPMQMYQYIFRENHVEGYNNPHEIVDSVAAATKYIAVRYGNGTPGSGLSYVACRNHWY